MKQCTQEGFINYIGLLDVSLIAFVLASRGEGCSIGILSVSFDIVIFSTNHLYRLSEMRSSLRYLVQKAL